MKVLVVGGGPGGVRAALRARELGAEVTLLESAQLGGTAFNNGPAPVRALARAARLRADSDSFSIFGLRGDTPSLDFKAAIANANRIANYANETRHVRERVEERGIEVIDGAGPARFLDSMTLEVSDGRKFSADRIILAVGGEPRKLSIPGNALGLSFNDLWELEELPARATIIGGSATGCQLASVLLDFGAKVDLVEFSDRLMPLGDVEISRGIEAAFGARGMNVLTGAQCQSIETRNACLNVSYQRAGETGELEAEAVIFAVGWPANVSRLGLEAAGIETRGPYIEVDRYLRTNVPHIYAVGDANGISMLVQSAMLQGDVAAENAILGSAQAYTPRVVASGSFTNPEYGSVGMTEEQAREKHDCLVEVVTYDGLPRAIIDARTEGLCKLIVDKETGLILGAHVLGSYSAEVIQVAATCMTAGMEVSKIAQLELAFPTFTEALGIAARRIVRRVRPEAPKQ